MDIDFLSLSMIKCDRWKNYLAGMIMSMHFVFLKRCLLNSSDLPPRKWTQRRENGRIAIISKEVSDGEEENKAV